MSTNEKVTRWTVELYLGDRDGHTHAEARLFTGEPTSLGATAVASLSPSDRYDVPEIGFELAAGRALAALAQQLLEAGSGDVERVTGTATSRR